MAILYRSAKGMTLIEVLVASLVLSTGIVGMLALQTRALTMVVISGQRQQASLLLQELAELVYISPDAFSNVDPMSLIAGDVAPVPSCTMGDECPAHLFARAELSAWGQAVSRRLPAAEINIERGWHEWTVVLRWHGPADFSQNSLQAELLL